MRVALITGGSAGLGLALVRSHLDDGWAVVTDGREAARLEAVARLGAVTVPGDVADPDHRDALAAEVARLGRLDLLVHNASTLGAPLRPLRDVDLDDLRAVWEVNTAAPHALTRQLLPHLLDSSGTVVAVSSDAAVEHYDTWGPYAASKAALDHLMLTLGAEEPGLTAYAVDPGDMRTAMHQDAFPGEDISDRPLPETVVPHFAALLRSGLPSGRYRLSDLAVAV